MAILPDKSTERKRYMLHENNPEDEDYKNFLKKLTTPLLKQLSPPKKGLDYGCGPGPAIPHILSREGYSVEKYDPFFHPDKTVLKKTYDFIVLSEVVEHFHFPRREFTRLNNLLRKNGWIAIMTCFQAEDDKFVNWYYRRDLTHVVFYKEKTFYHIAEQYGWKCEVPKKDVVLMHKF